MVVVSDSYLIVTQLLGQLCPPCLLRRRKRYGNLHVAGFLARAPQRFDPFIPHPPLGCPASFLVLGILYYFFKEGILRIALTCQLKLQRHSSACR